MNFDVIIEFCKAHIYELATILFSFVGLLIICFKKTKVTDNNFLAVLSALPGWIKEAEALEDKSMKYSYVFSRAVSLLVAQTGLTNDEVVKKYALLIDSSIEAILSTPQKKG